VHEIREIYDKTIDMIIKKRMFVRKSVTTEEVKGKKLRFTAEGLKII